MRPRPFCTPAFLFALSLGPAALCAQSAADTLFQPSPEPQVTIRGEGGPDYDFTSISAARRLPNGDIVVSDWGSQSLHFFTPDGRLRRKIGRHGAGPGEFQSIDGLYLTGDTLMAYDGDLRRLTRFTLAGRLLSTQLVQPTGGPPPNLAGRLRSGSWILTTPHAPSWASGQGAYRDTLRIGLLGARTTGAVTWLAAPYPGMSFFAYAPDADESHGTIGLLPLAANTIVRTHGDTIYIGDTAEPVLSRWGSKGGELAPLSLPLRPAPNFRALLDADRDDKLAQPGAERARAFILAGHELKRTPPRYRDYLIGTNGDIWFRLFEWQPRDSTPYLVLAPSGAVRRRLLLPPRSAVLDVDGAYVIFSRRDENDVASLNVVRLP